jgi:hypothetical protein
LIRRKKRCKNGLRLIGCFLFCHRKKYEIATDEDFTPIKQDEKKGQLREVRDVLSVLLVRQVVFSHMV